MQFVINGMKYETDNMEMVAEVKKLSLIHI